jgi:hypothetical protein
MDHGKDLPRAVPLWASFYLAFISNFYGAWVYRAVNFKAYVILKDAV